MKTKVAENIAHCKKNEKINMDYSSDGNDEDYDFFLKSEKRLFNRRGSNDSSQSSSLSSSPTDSEEIRASNYDSKTQSLVTSLNPEAQEFIPGKAEESTSSLTKKSSKRSKKGKSTSHRCCQFCLKKGYDEAMYGSHSMRKKSKELICPVLLSNL